MTAKRPSEVLAQSLPRMRDRRGWSQQDLADRLDQAGYPFSRVAVAKIEGGTRGVTLDDAVALAVALEVPLAVLVLPLETGEDVALVPGSAVKAWDAFDWMLGAFPLTDVHAYTRSVALLRARERLHGAQRAASTAAYRVESADALGRDDERFVVDFVDALEELATAIRDYEESGGDPRPLLDRRLSKALRERKIKARPRTVVRLSAED